jgi:UDP-glucuronate decarboxylase
LTGSDNKGPVNIGNPNEFTMLELAELIISLTGSRSTLSFEDLPGDDPKQRKPDISRAQSWLGWNPTIELEQGLTMTIQEFKLRI